MGTAGSATEDQMWGPLVPPEANLSLALPLGYHVEAAPWPTIAITLHLYYAELGPELRETLAASMAGPADLYVTTDTPAKQAALQECFAAWPHGHHEVRLVPNRGRDVAPRIVALGDIHDRYELCLHMHGKRSTYWEHGDAWRRDLVDKLAGSREVVLGAVEAFRRWPGLGIVTPSTFAPVLSAVSWGFDFDRCVNLGARMGIPVSDATLVHFPAGSMFWSRRGALRPLLDLGLTYEDFEAEDGLRSGSLAHAIERLVLYICEAAGFFWLSVDGHRHPASSTLCDARTPAELDRVVAHCLLELSAAGPDTSRDGEAESLRGRFRPDRAAPSRLSLIAGPEDFDPSSPDHPAGLLLDRFYAGVGFSTKRLVVKEGARLPSPRPDGIEVLELAPDGRPTPIDLGANDVVLAAVGAGADLAARLKADAMRLGEPPPLLRLHDPAAPGGMAQRGWSALRAGIRRRSRTGAP